MNTCVVFFSRSRAHRNDAQVQDCELYDADNRKAGSGAPNGEREREQRSHRRRGSQRNRYQQAGCSRYDVLALIGSTMFN